jgi:hypothetical protein
VSGVQTDRRQAFRGRTRLKPGKLLSLDSVFLADCAILDRSPLGTRIRLCEIGDDLPEEFVLFDESAVTVRRVSIVWRGTQEAGLVHESPERPVEARALPLIAGPYYAVR